MCISPMRATETRGYEMTSAKLKLYEYAVGGNASDGYEVNGIYPVITDLVIADIDGMSNKALVKAFHNRSSFDIMGSACPVTIDFRRLEIREEGPFLELVNKSGKPIGRVEIEEYKW